MLYLLDANVLIDAGRDYYPLDMVPEFWDWLVHHGDAGNIKVPLEVYEEVVDGNDAVAVWLRLPLTKNALLLAEDVDAQRVNQVVTVGYAADLTDDEVESIGRDPFIVAYGLVSVGERCIVTTEVSKPSKQRKNRKLPDVCGTFGLPVCRPFDLTRQLGFRTSWKAAGN